MKIQMGGHNIQKNQKNGKPNHIVFLCHIVSIQVDKQGLDISKPDKSCIYVPRVDLMKSSMKKSRFGRVSNMEISRTSQKLHFRATKKDRGLPFHFHDLNLFKSWSNLAQA